MRVLLWVRSQNICPENFSGHSNHDYSIVYHSLIE